jgi:hypothetical protein
MQVEGALTFSPLEEASGVMVIILPDLSKMVFFAHVVHRTPSPETFDLRPGPRRFYQERIA